MVTGYRCHVCNVNYDTIEQFAKHFEEHPEKQDHRTKHNLIRQKQEQIEILERQYRYLKESYAVYGKSPTYDNQKLAAYDILHALRQPNIQKVFVKGQPGVGKTGLMLYLMYLVGIGTPDDNDVYLMNEVGLISGLSDLGWKQDTRASLLDAMKDRVFHRGELMSSETLKRLSGCKLLIIDEAHIAAERGMSLDKIFQELDICPRNPDIKVVIVTATPDLLSYDVIKARDSGSNQVCLVELKPGNIYKGFQHMLDDGRIRSAPKIRDIEDALSILRIWNDRFNSSSGDNRYFTIRASRKTAKLFHDAAILMGWNVHEHNSKNRIESIDDIMKTRPEKPTLFLIKGFWKASHRMVTTYSGGTYKEPARKPNTTVDAQDLVARHCNHYEYDEIQLYDITKRPLHFTSVKSIRQYIEAYESGFDVSSDYTSSKYETIDGYVKKAKPSMCRIDKSEVSTRIAKNDPRKRVPIPIELTEEVYDMCSRKRGEDKKRYILNTIKEVNPTLYEELSRMKKNLISEPKMPSSVISNIQPHRDAIRDKRPIATAIAKTDQSENLYNIWLDQEKHTLMVVRWYGSPKDDQYTNIRTTLPDE